MGVEIHYSNAHLDFFTRNLVACRGSEVATACGYTSIHPIDEPAGSPFYGIEPLTVAEAKQHLRFTHDSEDLLVEAWIRAARRQVERDTSLALLTSRWRIVIQQFPSWRRPLRLPIYPIQSVDAFAYYDSDNVLQTFGGTSPEPWILSDGRPPALGLAPDEDWPTSLRSFEPAYVEVTAGWTQPELVPEELKQAMRQLIGQADQYRQNIVSGSGQTTNPVGFDYDRWIEGWRLPSA